MSEREYLRLIELDSINDDAVLDAAIAEMDKRRGKQAVIAASDERVPKEMFISSVWQDDPETERKGPRWIEIDDINDTAAFEAAMEEMWKYIPHKSHSVTRTNVS